MSTTDLKVNDEYYTPQHVWSDIKNYIPKGKVIWEPFNTIKDKRSLDSSRNLRSMGFKVVTSSYNPDTNKNDFFESNYGDSVGSTQYF